mgnify:CR=1 FL=1
MEEKTVLLENVSPICVAKKKGADEFEVQDKANLQGRLSSVELTKVGRQLALETQARSDRKSVV